MNAPLNTIPGASTRGSIVDALAAGCAIAFAMILGIAAYWDRTIRVLHAFESLPYIRVLKSLCPTGRESGTLKLLTTASGPLRHE